MTTQAPESQPVVAAAPEAPATQAPSQEFSPAQWLQGLDERQRSAIDEFAAFRTRPLESELHGLKTEVGRLKKAADPANVARLQNEEALVAQMKQATSALYGVDAKDLEDIETIEGLNAALKWISRGAQKPQAPAKAPAGADPSQWEQFLAFQAQKQGQGAPARPNGAVDERLARGGGPALPQVTRDNIDALFMEAERKNLNPNPYAVQYQRFLQTGAL